MSYSVDELYKFEKGRESYAISEYLKKDDPCVTELEIPAEYNGLPVRTIYENTFCESEYLKRVVIPPSIHSILDKVFFECTNLETVELPEGLTSINTFAFFAAKLKSVVFPKSLEILWNYAFFDCQELESVTFNSEPRFGERGVFSFCDKLPAEIILMDLVHSRDISQPFAGLDYNSAFKNDEFQALRYTRPDVLELAIKYDCFRNVDVSVMLKFLAKTGNAESLGIAGENGLINNAALLDTLLKISAENGRTETTAYLLDLKRRKFGFKGGEQYEL